MNMIGAFRYFGRVLFSLKLSSAKFRVSKTFARISICLFSIISSKMGSNSERATKSGRLPGTLNFLYTTRLIIVGADQTVLMRRLILGYVVRVPRPTYSCRPLHEMFDKSYLAWSNPEGEQGSGPPQPSPSPRNLLVAIDFLRKKTLPPPPPFDGM